MDILTLRRQGKSYRAIAKELGISRNTVKKYVLNPELPAYKPRTAKPTKLEPYKNYIQERVKAAKPQWIPATVLFREIKQQGYTGGEGMVRLYVAQFKVKSNEPVIRFETKPGIQMQIDFTTIRRGKRSLKAFVATLGYSRASFVRFFEHERTEAWIEGLIEAFHYFGGVPHQVLCDNAKAIVIERDAYGEGKHRWNSKMLDLAIEYGFQLKACRPYRAKTKGKVERFNHYLKNSFVTPLSVDLRQANLELDCQIANGKIGQWLEEIAHQRIHGTTGEKPQERLLHERDCLSSLPLHIHAKQPDCNGSETIKLAIPAESHVMQHPIHIYDDIAGGCYAGL